VEFKAFGKQGQTMTRGVVSPVRQHIINLDHEKWAENPQSISQELGPLRTRTTWTFCGNLRAVNCS